MIEHTVFETFPEWFINEKSPLAQNQMSKALDSVNQWQMGIIRDLVNLYDFLERERKESNGEIPVKACHVFQQKIIEQVLGCRISRVKQFLDEMDSEEG